MASPDPPEPPKPGSFRKGPPPPQPTVREQPPRTEVRNAPVMPGRTLASKIIKPVGVAVLLLALPAAGQVITAPFSAQPACPFPGCQGTTSVTDVSRPPYLAGGTGDQTAVLQRAIDSGAPILYFPAGTYVACGLIPRAPKGQTWVGAGKGQTVLQATATCTNLIAGSTAGSPYWEMSGFTLQAAAASTGLINTGAATVGRAFLHDNAFDLGFGQTATGAGGVQGIAWNGGQDLIVERNEFYSTLPGYGKPIVLFRGARHAQMRGNSWRWTYQGIELANVTGAEDILIDGNTGDLGWYAEPVKFTNSGGTVTYSATALTDTAANFSGLCNDAGSPGACAGITGNFVRVMTPEVNASATGIFGNPDIITDNATDFGAAGVKRGDLVRAASAGAFTTVTGVVSTHVMAIDGWVDNTTRRPITPPAASTPYTVYGWVLGQVASYTATTITLGPNSLTWFDWFGNTSTPTNGTLYEVMTHHPNYNVLVDNTALVQKARITNNTFNRSYADQIGLQGGQHFDVVGNHIADGQDMGVTVAATTSSVVGNIVDHQGTGGVFVSANDAIVADNHVQNVTWTNTGNTAYLGCVIVKGGNRAQVTSNKCSVTLAMALTRYGLTVSSTSDSAVLANNVFAGTFTVGPYRFDTAQATNSHIVGYHGETISNNSGTFSIEGGLGTEAQIVANAAQNGSATGCSDCTVANPCAASGTGAVAKRQGGAWVCN